MFSGKIGQDSSTKTSRKVITNQRQLDLLAWRTDVKIVDAIVMSPTIVELQIASTEAFTKPNIRSSPVIAATTTSYARIGKL